MNAAGSMSSASWRENSLVPGLVPGKKGGEIALPKCVHFHVTLLVNAKTHGNATLDTTFDGQRGRGYSPGETHSCGLGK